MTARRLGTAGAQLVRGVAPSVRLAAIPPEPASYFSWPAICGHSSLGCNFPDIDRWSDVAPRPKVWIRRRPSIVAPIALSEPQNLQERLPRHGALGQLQLVT